MQRYIQIKLTEGDSETLQRKLIDEDIELAVLFPLSHMNHLRYHLLQQDELVICCSRNHPFRRKNSLSMQDIAQEKLVILKQGCSYRQLLINYFESVNTLPAIQFEVDQIDTIKSLVANSNLLTILPSQLCEHHQDLVIIPFEEPIMIESSLVYKDKRALSHAAKALINALVPDATKHLGGENNEA
ncbi:LysR family transcriptional regulator substrate-binding protein [Veillonella caviae]|uniref:LysR family transcriptional regulator substrate-binding protein n=1 Tax=Veillonella caviae TaxID=248316 RepID=UPI0023A79C92|nr:LysR family transcriptional regulator substrate-binding protein [Veillonella caviae]MCI5708635.1 LysR family transcriptional regulator substrate-binding protein [Veillonella caviae]MDY5715347.1 LysR family transcriptional regulator substrate-binding protein [Veillonella caviae]